MQRQYFVTNSLFSLLMHAIFMTALLNSDNGVLKLDYDDFHHLGWLAFSQLAELRHRGAFSTVAQTFALCCAKCAETTGTHTHIAQLPELWYQVRHAWLKIFFGR